jgi:hypothetical protein
LGGFNQIRYLTDYKNRLAKILEKINNKDADYIKDIDTIGFNTFSIFFGTINNSVQEMYALDIIKSGGVNQEYLGKLNSLSVKEFLIPSLPIFYKVSVPEKYREELNFSSQELTAKLHSLFKK